jgi:hypothetical protein
MTGYEFSRHDTVNHNAGEYARGVVTTNTIICVFSVIKRGTIGVYQDCGEAPLHRYLGEFDFRYNRRTALKVTGAERHNELLAKIEGKCLTYRELVKPRSPKQLVRTLQRKRKKMRPA